MESVSILKTCKSCVFIRRSSIVPEMFICKKEDAKLLFGIGRKGCENYQYHACGQIGYE